MPGAGVQPSLAWARISLLDARTQSYAAKPTTNQDIVTAESPYLSLGFASFSENEMMSRAVGARWQFPFSAVHEGITYLSVHP